MAMRRENVAAALKYLQDKANLRQRFERATSLDPQEQDLADIAVETGASFIPGVGQALAARDVERARRANDPAGMAMASMGAIPGGRLAGLLKRYDPVMQQLDVYHGTPHKFPATEANPLSKFDAPEVKPGDIVDGLKVRPEVANVGSIKASLDNYTVLPGIRSVSIADFGEAGPLTGNVDKLDRRTRNLADQITESKEITPLIVVYSGTQNYILEGSHRIDALDALGKKRIPVIAVIDEDDPPKLMRQKR